MLDDFANSGPACRLSVGGLGRVKSLLELAAQNELTPSLLALTGELSIRHSHGSIESTHSCSYEPRRRTSYYLRSAAVIPHRRQSRRHLLELPSELRTETAVAIANLDDPEHDLVEAIEMGIKEKLGPNAFERQYRVGGVDALVDLLNTERETETSVLDALGSLDEHMASEVKRRLFLFEDITSLDSRAIQKILASVDMANATRNEGVGDDTVTTILENMSERAGSAERNRSARPGPACRRSSSASEIVAVVNRLDAEVKSRSAGGPMLSSCDSTVAVLSGDAAAGSQCRLAPERAAHVSTRRNFSHTQVHDHVQSYRTGREEGYDVGYAAGVQAAEADIARTVSSLQAAIIQLGTNEADLADQLAELATSLAVELATTILDNELKTGRFRNVRNS